jgi:hypothetical protein
MWLRWKLSHTREEQLMISMPECVCMQPASQHMQHSHKPWWWQLFQSLSFLAYCDHWCLLSHRSPDDHQRWAAWSVHKWVLLPADSRKTSKHTYTPTIKFAAAIIMKEEFQTCFQWWLHCWVQCSISRVQNFDGDVMQSFFTCTNFYTFSYTINGKSKCFKY